MITVTYEEFNTATKNKYLEEKSTLEEYLNQAHDIVVEYLGQYSIPFVEDSVSDFELIQIKKSIIEQTKYIIANGGDLGQMAGYDQTNNSLTNDREIRRRIVSPRAKKALENTKYVFRGIV